MAPIQEWMFYPKPSGLPKSVELTTKQLLDRLQIVLDTNASVVSQALRPGLSDTRIAELEMGGGFRLTEGLKALYRWHDGMVTNSQVGLLPGYHFVPLEESVQTRELMRSQQASATLAQRVAFSLFLGFRKNWIQILDDGAGDGYFYDPERAEAGGALFYHMSEVGYYRWFPSLENYLTGIIQCYENHAIKVSPDGKAIDEDSEQTKKIWELLAASSDHGE
ncbi:MAG TPA: SMI1/KNR4 family protein [Candidatus Limnocylindria bacterium]|nr:SMI1/KNR4 family protein [Candidatus Limnocylindria bacterium]